MSRLFPPLFFVGVLAGEDPVDHLQRLQLQGDRELHPLVERIMRIHITEEARHLSFARHLLTRDAAMLALGLNGVIAA